MTRTLGRFALAVIAVQLILFGTFVVAGYCAQLGTP